MSRVGRNVFIYSLDQRLYPVGIRIGLPAILRLTAIVGRFRDFVGDETQEFTLNSFHEVLAIPMIWIANDRAMSETRADQNGVEDFEAPLFLGSRLYRGLNWGSWSWCRYMVKVSRRIYELLAIKIVVKIVEGRCSCVFRFNV